MENAAKIKETIEKGSEDELCDLRMWLFKESCRLENQESYVNDRFNHLRDEEVASNLRIEEQRSEINASKKKLKSDQDFFEKKYAILTKGFNDLAEDKKKLAKEWDRLRYEEEYAQNEYDDSKELLFKGVNSLVALKKRYKDLIKIYHPDNICGDHDMIQLINKEYNNLLQEFDISMKA